MKIWKAEVRCFVSPLSFLNSRLALSVELCDGVRVFEAPLFLKGMRATLLLYTDDAKKKRTYLLSSATEFTDR